MCSTYSHPGHHDQEEVEEGVEVLEDRGLVPVNHATHPELGDEEQGEDLKCCPGPGEESSN